MPQLDTSTWFIMILSMIITLFFMFQLKVSKYYFPENPEPKPVSMSNPITPWEKKWTKIYSPLSLPLQ
ncbi:ATP synthase F0 subunit 8 (mitochondrion) [Gulo gulo luscus]|uniref:ATP synthase complex subunit 8 n=1 Tax=Gulo gulo TaxID=48420 RepID=Q679E7_GULGU|nr:ATP synthase F0 subunit 8 [Gulo gulo]KAI5756643.1 ATP synthase F0 subunit 8 [Gulo gulo luscus]AAQ93736.1 ATP synthase F0 subunit 8 [Gulo gulo]AGW99150.1 ATP synthase F0 subunit 8 [Gulo gulo]AKS28571.1 ATP synthase F0 subunit 8 [Gulo gulo]KAI5756656.1 ATP synthase F0 subunit 8 [Gulo gulo luscus]